MQFVLSRQMKPIESVTPSAQCRYRFSFMLRVDGIDPDQVTSTLGVVPDHRHRAQDPMPVGTAQFRGDSWWIKAKSPWLSRPDSDATVNQVLDRIAGRADSMRAILRGSVRAAFKLTYHTYDSQCGPAISAASLRCMAAFDIPLEIEVFSYSASSLSSDRPEP